LADVFLSYARPDEAFATRIARELGKLGISLWYDRELPAHRPYSDVIKTELEAASAVLVLWSSAAAESQWVRSEANRARELGKLVQARTENVVLPMPFDQLQCANLANWRGRGAHPGWAQVRKSIDALLSGDRSGQMSLPADSRVDRRNLVLGGGASIAVAGGATFAWLTGSSRRRSNPEAELLTQKGIDALQNNDVFAADDAGSLANAIALLTQATQADPQSAEAWGSLALAYAALKRVSPVATRSGLDSRSRSAAAETFKLKSHEPRATAALLLLEPVYRHWRSAEESDRAALNYTRSRPIPLLLFLLSDTLGSVGRWKEAAAVSIKADRRHFIIPGADRRVVVDLWAAGELEAADEALKLAIEHWPQQPQVWRTRIEYLMYSGRPSDALAVLNNEAERPSGTPHELVSAIGETARALASEGDAAEAVQRSLDYLRSQPAAVFGVAQACAALGDVSTTFAILNGYYFGEGGWRRLAPDGGDADRQTSPLFLPSMRRIWRSTQFEQLTRRIGLDDYWRFSRVVPDFRAQ
jgi:tetratricopeptide (TPR) repeat protein